MPSGERLSGVRMAYNSRIVIQYSIVLLKHVIGFICGGNTTDTSDVTDVNFLPVYVYRTPYLPLDTWS